MKFGWCTTGQHEQCRKMYVDWNQERKVCDCNCHPVAVVEESSDE